jgi:hypothetical protein
MVDVVHPSLFSVTAADNLAARGNSVAEGWLPSVVNNWGRAFMSLIAGLYDDLSGQNTIGGTANAITVTSNVPLTALAEGVLVAFQNSSGPNTAAVTLNLDGLGAKAIRLQGDIALSGGELADDGIYLARYDASANAAAGAWILLNSAPPNGIYTPTLTNGANAAASTAHACNYVRLGNMVIVSGVLELDPTTTATLTLVDISLPIASDLAAIEDLTGSAGVSSVATGAYGVYANFTNNRATLQGICPTASNHFVDFVFMYRVL